MAPRRTALFEEHLALGADMEQYQWAGMAMPWTYRHSLAAEQRAVREHAGLCDASQLQVLRVHGPEAVACLERLLPRRIRDMQPGTSRFSVVLSRFGRIYDDALVLRLDEEEFWIIHGCGGTERQLAAMGAAFEALDQPVLAVQGPLSLEVLAPLSDAPLGDIPFFGHQRLNIEGHPVLLSRTGFTGEPGFEMFCDRCDAVALWRCLLESGAPRGLMPYSYRCVDLLRVEAGFLVYPVDMAASIWELGLGWLLRDKDTDFVGRLAVEQARDTARYRVVGLRCGGEAPRGAAVRRDGQDIGSVSSSAWSPAGETLCIVRILRDAYQSGATVMVHPDVPGVLVELPFVKRRCFRAAAPASPAGAGLQCVPQSRPGAPPAPAPPGFPPVSDPLLPEP